MMILRALLLPQLMSVRLLKRHNQRKIINKVLEQQVRREESNHNNSIRLLKRRRRLSPKLLVRKTLSSLRDIRLRSIILIHLHKTMGGNLLSMNALLEVQMLYRRELHLGYMLKGVSIIL